MSLQAYTLFAVDDSLEDINTAVREGLEGLTLVQSSLTRADGASEEQVGMVLVVYGTKVHMNQMLPAKVEFTLKHGLETTPVYLEEISGQFNRQWLFNSGKLEDHAGIYEELFAYIQEQPQYQAFVHIDNICDILCEFFTERNNCVRPGDEVIFPVAGWLHEHHPHFYKILETAESMYDIHTKLAVPYDEQDG